MATSKILLLTLFQSVWSMLSLAQPKDALEPDLERVIEYFALQEEDTNYEELYENLTQLLSHPLHLNKVNGEELRGLAMLSEQQVNELISHRELYGAFISIYELQVLPSFTTELIRLIEPFVTVYEKSTAGSVAGRLLHERNNYLSIRLDRALNSIAPTNPDTASQHLGSPTRLFTRFRVSRPGEYSAGFTLEKDAGEILIARGLVPVFDYWSAHLQWKDTRWMRNAIVGDFTAQFGQGLVLGSGFGAGKGSETILTVRRSSLGFLPYTSATEHSFFRGAACTIAPAKTLKVHLFGSWLPRDAQVRGDTVPFISAFDVSGLHRNVSELTKRKTVNEKNYGAAVEFVAGQWQSGVLVHHLQYSLPLHPTPTPYNQFAFHGTNHINYSAFTTYGWHNFSLFAEVARSIDGPNGGIAGVVGSLTSRLDVSVLARRYHRGFFSPYANALSENTSPVNERGIYWGWKYQPRKRFLLSGYVDMFDFPWLHFRAYRPSPGMEFLLRVTLKPAKGIEIAAQGREERKERNTSTDAFSYRPGVFIKRNFFVNASCDAGKVKWKTRAQLSMTSSPKTAAGFAIVQDVAVDLGRLSLNGRYALFGTDDFDNRQYVYEADVWSAFSFPAYYGDGIRSMAMVRYNFSKRFDVWVRWSRTAWFDSGNPRNGPTLPQGIRSDAKVQVRWRI